MAQSPLGVVPRESSQSAKFRAAISHIFNIRPLYCGVYRTSESHALIFPRTVWLLAAVGFVPLPHAEAFLPSDRWQTTAGGAASSQGAPMSVSWSIVPDGTPHRTGQLSQLVAFLDQQFGVADHNTPLAERPWFPVVASAFDRWSQLGGLTLNYVDYDDGAELGGGSPGVVGVRGDIRLSAMSIDGVRGVLAASSFPDTGDIVIDVDGGNFLLSPTDNYRRLRNVLMHEIGHAFGLDHIESIDARFLMETEYDNSLDGPQIDDIRGLHYLYGDHLEGRGQTVGLFDDVVELGPLVPGGMLSVGGNAARQLRQVEPHEIDFVSISSRNDVDRYRIRTASSDLHVLLEPVGGLFRQGLPGEMQFLIDANASVLLTAELFTLDGQLLVRSSAVARGAGVAFDFTNDSAMGDYILQVRGGRDSIQLYSLAISSPANVVPEASTLSISLALVVVFRSLRRLRTPLRDASVA
jgi:hypothetical protein